MDAKPESKVAAEAALVLKECVKLANNIQSKKSNKELRKSDEKAAEYSLKFLNSLHSPEEKLSAITKKYGDVVDENRKFQVLSKQWEKKYVLMQREKDQIQSEYNKAILLKSKLENLCRELQRQIKAVKEESLLRIKEEEDRRKETLALFQKTISELTAAVQNNNEKNSKLRDDNLDMTEKFKSVMEQYELREHQVDKISKQMALEAQLSEAKLAKASLEAQAEREKLLAEKKQLLVDLTQYQARCNEMQSTEVGLRSQIAMYTDKYDEFQNALTKSNEVFGGFKGEMEKMSKKVEKQEKEAIAWKQRWEKSHAALLDMAADKQQSDSSFALQARQLSQLQRLCRTMQAERSILLNTLKDNNIERPPLPQLPAEPKPVNEGPDRVDIMAANCAQLKQSLSQLQGRLNDLTAKKTLDGTMPEQVAAANAENTAPVAQKKAKKGKGKKSKATEPEIPKNKDSGNAAADKVESVSPTEKAVESNDAIENDTDRLDSSKSSSANKSENPAVENNSNSEERSAVKEKNDCAKPNLNDSSSVLGENEIKKIDTSIVNGVVPCNNETSSPATITPICEPIKDTSIIKPISEQNNTPKSDTTSL